MSLRHHIGMAILVLGMAGCATTHRTSDDITMSNGVTPDNAIVQTIDSMGKIVPQPATNTIKMEPVVPSSAKEAAAFKPSTPEQLYSFSAKDQDIKKALAMFAMANHLTILPDAAVKGSVTISFDGLNLKDALAAITEPAGFYADFEKDGKLIYVRDFESRMFHVDYPRYIRQGNASTIASMSSGGGSSGGSSGGTSGGSSSGSSGGSSSSTGIDITASDKINFWGELEAEVKNILSDKGTVTINRMSGDILVRDHHARVQAIAKYIGRIGKAINRQVKIVATIMEVTKNDNSSVGIDWNRVTQRVALATTNLAIAPIPGITAGAPNLNATIQNKAGTASAVIAALREQGNVEVVSKPQVITMNNQPSMIKVGTDRTFFRIETIANTTSAGATTTTNDVAQQITIGLIMSITPQISEDGHVIMAISPIITTLEGQDTSKNGSTAPIMGIKQITSNVRVKSGENVVIGGLIDRNKSSSARAVPILGDIPFIGGFFTAKEKVAQTKELVIFITPYVIGD